VAVLGCLRLDTDQHFGIEHGLRQSITMIRLIGWPEPHRRMSILVLLDMAMTSLSAWVTLRRHLKV